ncbi:unnamed protein product [Spirodela intermedia]|uniref:Uncharacterized protein n=2 Tax=Spirodela intermedia TaxID=51605 RepID=A0A7I8JCH8_SPIIN|nr:unnamed protein product [Spirodela intermedia]CAA6667857.1 unnamed protein product [Spirodela intermedia]CAA7404673.1 unnamed protein product [Spirodela intermedia]
MSNAVQYIQKVSGAITQPMAVPISCDTNMDLGEESTMDIMTPQAARPATTPPSEPTSEAKAKSMILP